jgi:hypothetical protein
MMGFTACFGGGGLGFGGGGGLGFGGGGGLGFGAGAPQCIISGLFSSLAICCAIS